jgi:hypothetical protein
MTGEQALEMGPDSPSRQAETAGDHIVGHARRYEVQYLPLTGREAAAGLIV